MIKKLLALTEQELRNEVERPETLRIYPTSDAKDSNGIAILWAPFDYLNRAAQLAIVGVTPGPTQAMLSYKAVMTANAKKEDPQTGLAKVKAASSFRGPVMEPNLKSLLEHSGIAEQVGIDDIDNLWTKEAHKVHFTSTIKYPTFFNNKMYNNQIDSLSHPELRRYVEKHLAEELLALPTSAMIVALGSKGPRIVRHAANVAGINQKRIIALPHPSGSATGAVRDFLSERRTKSIRPCRCMLCDRSRIPPRWNLSDRFARHDQTHRSAS